MNIFNWLFGKPKRINFHKDFNCVHLLPNEDINDPHIQKLLKEKNSEENINWIDATQENIENYLFENHESRKFGTFSDEKSNNYVFLILDNCYNTITACTPDCSYKDGYYEGEKLRLHSNLDSDGCSFQEIITHFALKSEYEAILPKINS
jgi:hypothetical protein